ASRPKSLDRETTPPAPARATPPATASDPTADTMFPIIDRDWVRTLLATAIAFASDVTIRRLRSDPAQDRPFCASAISTCQPASPSLSSTKRAPFIDSIAARIGAP